MSQTSRLLQGPVRRVVKADLQSGRCFGNNRLSTRCWELTLECGHRADRRVRFPKGTAGRGWKAMHRPAPLTLALPEPKKVRCLLCLPNAKLRDAAD